MVNFSVLSSSPPAAAANTSFFNGSALVAVPSANGVREFLNAMAASYPGRQIVALNGAVNGTAISNLTKGNANYTAMMDKVLACKVPGDQVVILWDQGEGDALFAPPERENAYKDAVSQLHADMVADMGLTKATCPFVMAVLGTTTHVPLGTVAGGISDLTWQTIKNALINSANEQPYVHISHSNTDLVRTDDYHYDAVSQGIQGRRFGQTVKTILGAASGEAHWKTTTGTVIDATNTDINLLHSAGTDFTPTSGGDGWEVSGDNGATWSAATSARVNATKLRVTTSASLSTSSARRVRYQYGRLPAITAPILDNSPLAVPLMGTTWDIAPTPLSVVPAPTGRYTSYVVGNGTVQTLAAIPLGPDSYQKFVLLALAGLTNVPSSVVLAPSAGASVSATLVKRQGKVAIYKALLGTDANASTTFDLTINYASNPFGGNVISALTVPVSDLSSQTETGTGGASASSTTAATATVNVSSGGFIVAAALNSADLTDFTVFTGTESFAKRGENPAGIPCAFADAANAAANASSSVTSTFTASGNIDLAIAAFR